MESISACVKNSLVGDDNKRIFSDKRFLTFKQKYNPYKEIYEKNKKHLKFANWHFESKLLGYSYSQNIREIFKSEVVGSFNCSDQIKSQENNSMVRFVGTVNDIVARTSANGNKYARIEVSDEAGNVTALMLDSAREMRYTNYVQSGKVLPKKGAIIILIGKKSNDIVIIEKLTLLEDKIYMKLSEVK